MFKKHPAPTKQIWGKPKAYPFDEMPYGGYFFINCDTEEEARRKQLCVRAAADYYKAKDYKINTYRDKHGVCVLKIKKENP